MARKLPSELDHAVRPLPDTVSRLAHVRRRVASFAQPAGDRLVELRDFGSNPGALRGWIHVPQRLRREAALVVVLHGCTQTAAAYDHGSGWSEMADRHGFVALFPEQQRQNNPNLCFSWFNPGDIRRGAGEALSIRQMVETAGRTLGIDPAKVFVTGLSAGGAMANVMLATYPEVFAGGAIIAGLPFGCAGSVPQALERMRGLRQPDATALAELAAGASEHPGPWPTISVWQGSADATVTPANAGAIVDQWRGVHGIKADPTAVTTVGGARRSVWRVEDRDVIERFDIPGMGHGTPLKTQGEDGCGMAGPFMLEVGISSTATMCRSWNLLDDDKDIEVQSVVDERPDRAQMPESALPALTGSVLQRLSRNEPSGKPAVGQIIEDALRKAGLMQ